ncbi:MAG: alkaline phosphatase family protein, partial [Acidobacteria bacterium]|nr:alkaline phosphatase family protein [Acidobacteriota bacterium]
WTLGFDTRMMTVRENEHDICKNLVKRPDMDYFDYYNSEFDHVSHHNNDDASRIASLRDLDRTIGHIWTCIEDSPRAAETALVVVSDHGFNSSPKVYSQGFNLVKLLGSPAGGGHHVITKRFLMMSYAIKSLNPLASMVRTSSEDSYYLKGQADKYPTALLDFDGNERSSLHLRNSDLNRLHLLLLELKKGDLKPAIRDAAADGVIEIIEKDRSDWQQTSTEMTEELNALERWKDAAKPMLATLPIAESKTVTREQAWNNRRVRRRVDDAETDLADYRRYLASLAKLLAVKREDLTKRKFDIEELIAPNSMGDQNSLHDLENYVVGLGQNGLVVGKDGKLDSDASFRRVDYFQLLLDQRVRNNVQEGVSSHPIDFVAVRVPVASVRDSVADDLRSDDDAVLMYAGAEHEVLLLTRKSESGEQSYRYLPIANFRQTEDGRVSFERREIRSGLPLGYFEDPQLSVAGDRAAWFNSWHDETEWLHAVHKTTYSIGIIGLNEQMDDHPFSDPDLTGDAGLIHRFRLRQRRLTEADILIMASDHWNFDVRGFNPGGNHGSFFRASTNSTFMIAGGDATGIPRGLTVEEPYDSLSFVPTLMRLLGKTDDQNRPIPTVHSLGYRKFPGRVVREVVR